MYNIDDIVKFTRDNVHFSSLEMLVDALLPVVLSHY